MGFKKDVAPVVEKPEVPIGPGLSIPAAQYATEAKAFNPANVPALKKSYAGDEAKVRGQVRMHGIIAGYKVASALAPTLANTSASIKDELHKLAVEVAAKIEAYSFSEE